MKFLVLILVSCAASSQGARKCSGPDVGFVMQSYTYLARMRCIDGRDVAKNNRVTSLVRKDGCYEDHTLVQCVDDPKWTELVFVQGEDPPPPPLGFLLITEAGYIQYKLGLNALGRGEYGLAALAFDSAAASSPDIALLHQMHGLALLKMGQLRQARVAFERAVALAPGALAYRLALASLLDAPAAYEQLKSIERDAPPEFPQSAELWCRLSRSEPDAKAARSYRERACRGGFKACCPL